MSVKVMIIEDDSELSSMLKEFLETFEMRVSCFQYPKEALEYLRNEDVDIIVLDLSLPQIDGIQVCKIIRTFCTAPLIISSARGNTNDKVLGFEIGADDYLAKPYDAIELVMRIKALLKRTHPEQTHRLQQGPFCLDAMTRQISFNKTLLPLSTQEYDILQYLLHNPNVALSREDILEGLGKDFDYNSRSVDMHISKLRHKIEDNAKNPRYIKSIWAIGYMLCV